MLGGIPYYSFDTPKILAEISLNLDFAIKIQEYINIYTPYLWRITQRAHFHAMFQGALGDLNRKSMEPIALTYTKDENGRNLSYFMSDAKWDHEGMLRQYQADLWKKIYDPLGMVTIDGTDFPKDGHASVGVASQYCGATGKTDNCQASVFLGLTGQSGYGLLDYELYMPEDWFDDKHAELRDKCQVPENLTFKTKLEIAHDMLDSLSSSGLALPKYVGFDSSFGNSQAFLDSIPEGLIYFADVKKDRHVFPTRPVMLPKPYSGRGRKPTKMIPSVPSLMVEELINDDSTPWEDVVLGIGANGPIFAKDKCLKVVEYINGQPGKDVWLYSRQLSDGKIKYALCNESMDATKDAIRIPALMRWSIEQCFKECKKYLGMDHYELRSWTGWRRHMLITLLVHLFITEMRTELADRSNAERGIPINTEPVSVEDYIAADTEMQNGGKVDHPKIMSHPTRPQLIFTIGLVQQLIVPFLAKIGKPLKSVKHALKNMYDAFRSKSRAAVAKAKVKLVPRLESVTPLVA
jgi:SRSO17 transposase